MAAFDDANLIITAASIYIGGDLGYIKDGVHIAPSIELYTIEGIEGRLTSPVARRTKESYVISTTLLECTYANWRIAWDVTNAAAGTVTNFGGDSFKPNERTVLTYSTVPGGVLLRTWTFTKCVVSSVGEHVLSQFGEIGFPVSFMALYDTATSKVGSCTDAV
jgi:hypothetical protein